MTSRRTFLASAAAAPIVAGIGTSASAQSTPRAAPGLATYTFGEFRITAISDGYLPLPPEFMLGLDAQDYAALLDAARFPGDVYTGGVAAFLIETSERTHLIDAGTGPVMGPTLGQFGDNLASLGVEPGRIDMVLATHLHPDHIGGLMGPSGTPFVNAELVVHEADLAFWTDDGIKANFSANFQPFFDLAKGVSGAFNDRLRLVNAEVEVAPGITVVPLVGHTPGHVGYRIESRGKSVLMWGDVVHAAPIQLARPEVGLAFDVDPTAAAQTRARMLDMAATEELAIIGSHMPFPGFGHIERESAGYSFAHSHWDYG